MQEINNFELTGVNNFKHFLLNLPQSTERGLVVFSGVLENKNIYKNAIFTALKKTENRIVTNLVINEENLETTIGKNNELEANPIETLNLILKEIKEEKPMRNINVAIIFEEVAKKLIETYQGKEEEKFLSSVFNYLKKGLIDKGDGINFNHSRKSFVFITEKASELIDLNEPVVKITLEAYRDILIGLNFLSVFFIPVKTKNPLFKEDDNVKNVLLAESENITLEEIEQTAKEIKEVVSDSLEYEQKTKKILEGLVFQNHDLKQKYLVTPFYNATIQDFLILSDKEARFRKGFETNEEEVVVPTFSFLIEGFEFELYLNILDVIQKNGKKHKNNFVLLQDKSRKYDGLFVESYDYEETFFSNETTTHSAEIERIKAVKEKLYQKHREIISEYLVKEKIFNKTKISLSKDIIQSDLYRFKKFNKNLNDFLLRKINDFIEDRDLNEEKAIHLISLVLKLKQEIIEYVDGLNPSTYIPTILTFLQGRMVLEKDNILMLGFLRTLGFDIIILSPAALSGIKSEDFDFNLKRLEKTEYDIEADDMIKKLLKETEKRNMSWFDKVKALFK